MPVGYLLGDVGEGFVQAMKVLDGGRISIAADESVLVWQEALIDAGTTKACLAILRVRTRCPRLRW